MAEPELSASEIRKLWQNDDFYQSFTGLGTFRDALRTERNYNISLHRLKDIMNKSTAYLDWLRRPNRFKRRTLQTDGYLQLMQADLAHFFNYKG